MALELGTHGMVEPGGVRIALDYEANETGISRDVARMLEEKAAKALPETARLDEDVLQFRRRAPARSESVEAHNLLVLLDHMCAEKYDILLRDREFGAEDGKLFRRIGDPGISGVLDVILDKSDPLSRERVRAHVGILARSDQELLIFQFVEQLEQP